MFGPRLTTVFASRWRALWFGVSVLLLAYCSVPTPEQTAAKEAAAEQAQQQAHRQATPWWAKDAAS